MTEYRNDVVAPFRSNSFSDEVFLLPPIIRVNTKVVRITSPKDIREIETDIAHVCNEASVAELYTSSSRKNHPRKIPILIREQSNGWTCN